MLRIQLNRDLRKNILRGHPWVYREAILVPKDVAKATLCEIVDKKGKPVGWGIYSPESILALRVLSTDRKPPGLPFFTTRLQQAFDLRKTLLSPDTNCYRLVNGEGDGLPGLVCDVYGEVAVLQFDGFGSYQFWNQDWLRDWLLLNINIKSVYFKPRFTDDLEPQTWGEPLVDEVVAVIEKGIRFLVNIREGQKTGFFLDQRENRQYLRSLAKDKSVLNLFSYTGGFSVYAGMGEASEVVSVDMAPAAIDLSEKNWLGNNLSPGKHRGVCEDVFTYVLRQERQWDIVIVDPPSMTHSEKTKIKAIQSYTDLFAKTAKLVAGGGHLCLSSCSSHITNNDFYDIINEALSSARRTGKILRISGQGPDHPFPHFCHELRYLKFVHLQLNQ